MTIEIPRHPSAQAVAHVRRLLEQCDARGASDLHLAPGLPPHFRIEGILAPDESAAALTDSELLALAAVFLERSGRRGLEEKGAQDGALTSEGGTRFRFNVYQRLGGLAIAVRRLEDCFRTLGELGLPERLYELCSLPDGIVLVAGPTGSGKSTTLAALIDRINRTRQVHVVTIEDPIEYIHLPIRSLIDQRQVGSDASSFHDALVASLRQDPDVLLVGEIRDLETIRTAIRAAETGHLVFTTVHAGDAVGTIERLVSVFPANEQRGIRQQLSLVLRTIVAQVLLPGDGPAMSGGDQAGRRIVASEVLVSTPAVANLVARGKSAHLVSAMEAGTRHGMQTLEEDLSRLVRLGKITEATARAATRNPETLTDRLAAARRAVLETRRGM